MTLVVEEDSTITIKDIMDNTPAKPDKPDKPDKPSDLAKPGPGGNVPGTGDNSRP